MALVDIDWNPSERKLRDFGLSGAGLIAAFGTWLLARHGAAFAGVPLLFAAAALVPAAMTRPAWVRPLYVGLTAIGMPIGLVVSWSLMALIFYGLVTPLGLFFRLTGRNALALGFDPGAASYWEKRPPAGDPESYFHPF